MSLALGLFTSMTFLALNHIFIIWPILYFLTKTDFKKINKSSWCLLAMGLVFILSVLVNQDIASQGYSPISKTKYYFLAVIMIAPISYYFKTLDPEIKTKKINGLILAFLITATLAGIAGIYGMKTGFNPLKWSKVNTDRNSGLAGMVLNYAHNLAFFQVIITGLIFYRNEIKKYINLIFLYIIWAFNLIALVMTYTRGAILAFVVAIPFYFLKKNKKIFVATGAVLLIITSLTYKLLGELILRGGSDIERLSQWRAALAGFKERPIFGFGYLNFESQSIPLKLKYGIEASYYGGHAHNNYLEALASTGIFGFLLFMLWQIFWLVEMYKRDDLIAKLAIPFIVAFIVSGQTQATFTLGANLFFIMSVYTLTQLNFDIVNEKAI